KYALAVTNELIDTFGDHLMIGYDIGCRFSKTANSSPLLGPKIRKHKTRFCVGSFHGHAHCRLCQIDWHPSYIQGSGLEDFKTCKRVFSYSNALASSTRHASVFHRCQLIHQWFKTWNDGKFAECSKFMYSNCVQALNNISSISDMLHDTMQALKIPSEETFEVWLKAEKQYLLSLKKELPENTMHIEYFTLVVKLRDAE
ncbi:hypothetical protein BU17DRAFT_59280, partial [Hysterangium stoloniferum]